MAAMVIIRYTRPANNPMLFLEGENGAESFLHICDNEAHAKEMIGVLGLSALPVKTLRPYAGFQLADAKEYPISSNPEIRIVPCFDWTDAITDDKGRLFVRATDFIEAESYQAAERLYAAEEAARHGVIAYVMILKMGDRAFTGGCLVNARERYHAQRD
jgi:hypothetical protein